jgi:hypothetical protein
VWTVLAHLYDCIWTATQQARPTFFSAQQQAILDKLEAIAASTSPPGPRPTTGSGVDPTRDLWLQTQMALLLPIAARAVRSYLNAIWLTRYHALGGTDSLRTRLSYIALFMGPGPMRAMVEGTMDPTDSTRAPAMRRHILYLPEMFAPPP